MATESTLSTEVPMGKIFLIIIFLLLTNCSKTFDFDGFDPTTTTVKWIIKGKK